MMQPPYFFLAFLVVAVSVAIIASFISANLDEKRIRQYFAERGGRLISVEQTNRTARLVGEKQSRLYEVRYLDCDGNEHFAYAKTGYWTGVYFTEDRIVEYARPNVDLEEVEWLRAENARLRTELERLQGEPRNRNSDAIQE